MKKSAALLGMLLGATTLAGPATAAEVKIGIVGDITGAIAAMAPEVMKSYDFAIKQVNDQGGFSNGDTLAGVVGDSGCNPQLGADAVNKAVNVSGAIAVVGPWCSGAVIAASNSVTIPAGIALVTPGGTSPTISTLKDNDTVFRTVPSDEYQGQALARTVMARGTKTVAVSFLNNDYGKGLAEAFKSEFEKNGGTIAGYAAHEEGKPSYRSDIAELAKGGADTLVLFDYGDGAGLTILRESLENGFFQKFYGGEAMKTPAAIKGVGAENLTEVRASAPVADKSDAAEIFNKAFKESGGDPNAVFTNTAYDAVFMVALAIEKAGGDKAKVSQALREISSGSGEPILPGEWKKAKELIAAGKAVDYKGASGDLDFDKNGDVPGDYSLFKVEGDDWIAEESMK